MKSADTLRIFTLSSVKGGVGRSTLAVGLSKAFARRGKRVLLLDLDDAVHTCDILLGAENDALFGFSDLLKGRQAESVLLSPAEGLYLCPAPDAPLCADVKAVKDAAASAVRHVRADLLLIDAPARGVGAELAAELASEPIVVSQFDPVSALAAEITAKSFFEKKKRTRLILNRAFAPEGAEIPAKELIDRTHSPLLGVLPDNMQTEDRCFDNMASRLDNEERPLFEGLSDAKKLRRLLI